MQPSKLETRTVSSTFQAENEGRRLVGYAAKFDSLSEDLGGFVERILPGAFARSLEAGADVRCFVEHDPSKLLGRVSAGTLRLREDEIGLRVECDLPEGVSYAEDLRRLLARGDINQFSFGFRTPPGGDEWGTVSDEDPRRLRTLRSIDLVEVSCVAIPAYEATEAALRSLAQTDGGKKLLKLRAELLRLELVGLGRPDKVSG
jgi:HK97 family phage prohead protease